MNDLIQTGFDYAALPVESVDRLKTVKRDIAIIDKLACVQIGQKLKEAQSELNMRGKKGAGFQEWVEAETPYALTAAYEMMRIADRFGENDMRNSAHHFSYSVLARLSAPSTPESVVEKAIEKAESGAKVTVADVKDWKAELDAATQRCEEFRHESNERRKTIRTLEEQIDLLTTRDRMMQGRLEKAEEEINYLATVVPEPEKVIVAPDDYETTKTKAELPHGQFLPWIAAEFEMSRETADNFISVHKRFGDKLVNFTSFKPSILYALSAPSTPDAVIEKAIEKAESGAKVTVADVKDWKAELDAERQARERTGEPLPPLSLNFPAIRALRH